MRSTVTGLLPMLALLYVDPSSSSLLMQILAPLFVFFAALAGHLRKRIGGFFRRIFGGGAEESK